MKSYTNNIIIIIFLVLWSCSGQQNKSEKKSVGILNRIETIKTEHNSNIIQIDIPNGDLMQELKKSSIIDSVWHVKLQTTEQSIFGNIDQLIVYDNSIFILDASNTKSLYEFNLDGTFIRKYGKVGKGPAEYIMPMSFAIDEKSNRVLLFDNRLSRVLFFNRDGSLSQSQKVKFYTQEICVLNNSRIIFNNRKSQNDSKISEINAHYLTVADFNGKILLKALPYDEDIMELRYHTTMDFCKTDNAILYHPAFSDTIYSVNENNVSPKYVFNFGSKRLPSGFDKNISFKEFKMKYMGEDKPYAYFLGAYFEVGDKLFFRINFQKRVIFCIYSLKTKTLKYGGKIFGDFSNDFNSFLPVAFYKNFVITPIDPNFVMKEGLKSNNSSIKDIANKTSISDNPILSFQRLKDF